MSLPKPQYIANMLVERGSNPEYIKLEDALYSLVSSFMPNLSSEETWDYIEQYKEDVSKELFLKENDSTIDGITLNFDISDDNGDYYIKFFDKPEITLLRKLQNNSPENFEIFCAKILEKLGGSSAATGKSHDGGIDFMCSDLMLNGMPQASTKGSKIFVIGQAKRYKDGAHVTETELRGFIGASVKRIEDLKKTRADQFGIFQPVIIAFWTTSDFHSNGKQFAKEMGIWYLGGIALSQLAIKLDIEC
jgi:hypothetical protein